MITLPVAGQPVRVLLAELDRTVWWGVDADGHDIVAATDGAPMTWGSPEEAVAAAAGHGWAIADGEATTLDLRPAADWADGRRLSLDPVAALTLWNLAGDVARSIGLPLHDRGRIADRCYDRLVAANLPWLTDQAAYSPRWTKEEHRRLRQQLSTATELLARAMAARD